MRGAAAEQREVTDLELELVTLAERRAQLVEQLRRHVDDIAADLTHEVLVRVTDVVHGRAMPDMSVLYDTHVGQRVERPVDRCEVYLRMVGLNHLGQLLGGEVPGGFHQRRHDDATRSGDPAAFLPESIENVVDLRHDPILRA